MPGSAVVPLRENAHGVPVVNVKGFDGVAQRRPSGPRR